MTARRRSERRSAGSASTTDVSQDAGGFTATDFDALVRRNVITEEANSKDGEHVLTGSSAGNPENVIPERWMKSELEVDAFAPWANFAELESVLPSIPMEAAGVYVVLRDRASHPDWPVPSPVGVTWRGDPTVSLEALQANWVAGASVIYIGKAKQRHSAADFGRTCDSGRGAVAALGGRLVWQLDAPWELKVAWRIEAHRGALDVERDLLGAFRMAHGGRPPFANNPDRLGR